MLAFLVILLSAFQIALAAASSKCPPSNIIGNYFPAYASDQTGAAWSNADLTYYFVAETTQQGFTIPADQSNLHAFVKEARAKKTKPLITIGGWTGSRYFSDLVATAAARNKFAKQIVDLVKGYKLDGVDLDWEYPNGEGIGCNKRRPEDAANFLAFLKVLRAGLGTKSIISAAVAGSGMLDARGSPLKDVSGFGEALDYLTLMTYDTYGSWSDTTGPNDPLYDTCSDLKASVSSSVAYWTKAGFPACKLLIGVPSYAYSFTTLSSTLAITKRGGRQSLLYQAKSAVIPKGNSGDEIADGSEKDICGNSAAAGYSGTWTYRTMISDGILSADGKKGLKGFTRYWDSCSRTPFLFNKKTRQFIAYEDSASVLAKTKFAKSKGLAGIIVFDSLGFNDAVYKTARTELKKSKRSLHLA